jgi:cell division septation protein DedD
MLGLLIVVGAGFAVGLVAGVVWEEPELAFAYFAGDTEDVAWTTLPVRTVPDVAAPSPAAPPSPAASPSPTEPPSTGIADPKTRREIAAAEPESAPAAPAAPGATAEPVGRFSVQVGAFASSQAADGLANDLRAKGFEVYVSPGTKAGESRWRVRVGPVATRPEAEAAAKRLKQVEKLPTWILDEDAT